MIATETLLIAVALDTLFGEPAGQYHPLLYFGKLVGSLENRFLCKNQPPAHQLIAGCLALLIALGVGLIWFSVVPAPLQELADVLVLYFCIAACSLRQHAAAVYNALQRADLAEARLQVAKIVSRQTAQMNEADIRRATIESVLENGSDAVFAPIFWFAVLGPYGALLYRLSNTLDAMWGYKNQRYLYFGRSAARLDDLLNWVSARLTALSYAILGNTGQSLLAWRKYAHLLASPNAGLVMAAGAGSLGIRLGGPAFYHGKLYRKPWFGGKKIPDNRDITLSYHLVYRTLGIWLALFAAGDYYLA